MHCLAGLYLDILERLVPGIDCFASVVRKGRAVFSSSDLNRAKGHGIPAEVEDVGAQEGPRRTASLLHVAAQSLFATFFPSECRLCQNPLTTISRLPVCDDCLAHIERMRGRVCASCGERIFTAQDEALCGECRTTPPAFVRALAYGSYDGGLRELIHLLKYDGVRPAAGVLGRMLAEVIEGFGSEFISARVIPVPLHRSKLRQRGFNQSEEIARAALKHLRRNGLTLATGVLHRRRDTESQTGLSDHQRQENVRGAFIVTAPEDIENHDVLLVDDVFTTGATVSECARVLRRAGAERVFVATVARVLKSEATWATPPEAELQEAKVLKAYA